MNKIWHLIWNYVANWTTICLVNDEWMKFRLLWSDMLVLLSKVTVCSPSKLEYTVILSLSLSGAWTWLINSLKLGNKFLQSNFSSLIKTQEKNRAKKKFFFLGWMSKWLWPGAHIQFSHYTQKYCWFGSGIVTSKTLSFFLKF